MRLNQGISSPPHPKGMIKKKRERERERERNLHRIG